MKLFCISHFNTKSAGGGDESSKRFDAELSFIDFTLIDTNGSQQRQPPRMAYIEQTVEMSVCAIHFVSSLRPENSAGLRKFTIGCTAPANCCLHEMFKRALDIQPIF